MNIFSLIPGVNSLVKTVFGDKEARDKQSHIVEMAVHNQFSNEFGHAKTWWDSLINGINRLPRPFMTFGVIYMFYYCINDPEGFKEAMMALKEMPKEGWYLMGMIAGFWFGGKLPSDFGKLKKITPAIASTISKIKPSKSRVKTADPEWNERVEKRYSHYDNLNE